MVKPNTAERRSRTRLHFEDAVAEQSLLFRLAGDDGRIPDQEMVETLLSICDDKVAGVNDVPWFVVTQVELQSVVLMPSTL